MTWPSWHDHGARDLIVQLNILADENIPALEHYLGPFGQVRRISGRALTADQLADVDVLLVRSVTPVNESLLHTSPVRFVGTATSGIDHIDRDYLAAQSIGFAYAPGSNANSVVEYVLAAVAAIDGKLEQLLAGGSVGIVGYGVIGKAVAARLQSLGITYCVYDPWLERAAISQPASLSDVLDCDVVTLHAELTRRQPWPSFHLLDEARICTMRPGASLINASRGPVVDNAALLRLLRQGRAPVCVLDVWEGEPAIDHELLDAVALGTPHIAGYSSDGKLLATAMMAAAVAQHFGVPFQERSSPAGSAGTIDAAGVPVGPVLMRHLLQSRYDINQDDKRLRSATNGRSIPAAAQGFDDLRRNYPVRRELFGSVVSGVAPAEEGLQMLQALGCTVPNEETS